MKRGRHAPRSSSTDPTPFRVANRVFHQKFGTGSVTAIDGNTSGVNFKKIGDKRRDSPWRADNSISQPSHHSTLRHGRCGNCRPSRKSHRAGFLISGSKVRVLVRPPFL
jgi:hypothetical protein